MIDVLPFFQRLHKRLGITMTPNAMHYLETKQVARTKHLADIKQRQSKKTWNKRKCDWLIEQTKIASKE